MTKIIAIDLDETLAETLDEVLKFNNYQINGISAQKDDISSYYIHEIKSYNASLEYSIARFRNFFNSKQRDNIKQVDGVKTKLQERKNKGYKLIIITARIEEYKSFTQERIQTHLPNLFDDIVFANHFSEKSRSKGDLCKEIGASIMIEDNLQYAEELAQHDITTYLLAKPRNIQYQNTNPQIIKVNSREEILI